MPTFLTPLALIAAAAIPALAAIYLLRSRLRRKTVSSLMLWQNQGIVKKGGTRIKKISLPKTFYLELLIILLLVAAAMGPTFTTSKSSRPAIIILDDSYSMRADNNGVSPRDLAIEMVSKILDDKQVSSVRLITAGKRPYVLSHQVKDQATLMDALQNWHCKSPSDSLDAALNLANSIGGRRALIQVISDKNPDTPLEDVHIQWAALGVKLANTAIINASRTIYENNDRCMVEIVNFGDMTRETDVSFLFVGRDKPFKKVNARLEPNQRKQIIFSVQDNFSPITVQINSDPLGIDNKAVLLSDPYRQLPVQFDIRSQELEKHVREAVLAAEGIIDINKQPRLYITDKVPETPPDADQWVLLLVEEDKPVSYTGPYIVDHTHPLTQGLSLDGIIWGAGTGHEMPGDPVILAGNIPLITDTALLNSNHLLRLRISHQASNLAQMPAWPIIFCNLTDWIKSLMPGFRRTNIRLGTDPVFYAPSGISQVTVVKPDKTEKQFNISDNQVIIENQDPGIYLVKTKKKTYRFASNALSISESDLSRCKTGRYGQWKEADTVRKTYFRAAWIFILIAVGLLIIYQLILSRMVSRGMA